MQGQLHIQAVFTAQLACAGLAALVTAAFLRIATAETEAPATGFLQARDAMRENGGRLVRVLGFAAALQCVRKGRNSSFPLLAVKPTSPTWSSGKWQLSSTVSTVAFYLLWGHVTLI